MIFFGVNTGRVGSLHLAKVLNTEKNFMCLHEGKTVPLKLKRVHKKKQKTILRHLAEYNFIGYKEPNILNSILLNYRKIPIEKLNKKNLGDIAYYNAIFLPELIKVFKKSKFIYQIRNYKDFIQSCSSTKNDDFAPVGWKLENLSKTKTEKYLDLMRLRPKKKIKNFPRWEDWDAVSKNMWLWHETNKLILSQYKKNKKRFFILKAEDFKKNPIIKYSELRVFLGIRDSISKKTLKLLNEKNVNFRQKKSKSKFVGPKNILQKKIWHKFVKKTSIKLGYYGY